MSNIVIIVTAAAVLLALVVAGRMALDHESREWWVPAAHAPEGAGTDLRVRELRNLLGRVLADDAESRDRMHALATDLAARRTRSAGPSDSPGTAEERLAAYLATPPKHMTTRRLDELVTTLEEL